jgi:hypothetical protein
MREAIEILTEDNVLQKVTYAKEAMPVEVEDIAIC